MSDAILQALGRCPAPLPGIRYVGARRDGSPLLEREMATHPEGTVFVAPEARAEQMRRARLVRVLDLDPNVSRLARLALAVCPAPNAAAASVAAVGIARAWSATPDGPTWTPAPAKGLGLTRDGWAAGFPDPEAARAFFLANPEATPLFSFHEGEHRLAFAWINGGLIAVPTETQKRRV